MLLRTFILISLVALFAPSAKAEAALTKEINQTLKTYPFHSNKKRQDVLSIWQKLNSKKHVVLRNKEVDLRNKAVVLQSIIEASIIKLHEKGVFTNVIVIVHNPTPPTPLKVTNDSIPVGIVSKEWNDNPIVKETILNRHNTFMKFLDAKGTIIATYDRNLFKRKNAGAENYNALLKKYSNLLDKPLKNLPVQYHGVTYMMKDKQNNISAFSMRSSQISTSYNKVQEWEIWLGSIKDKTVSKRIVTIDSFLKSVDVDMYRYFN
jgi:hypothetical protein